MVSRFKRVYTAISLTGNPSMHHAIAMNFWAKNNKILLNGCKSNFIISM
jgi:hypothetical protein